MSADQAPDAYELRKSGLADATEAIVAAGGRLFGTDDGLLHVTYPCP